MIKKLVRKLENNHENYFHFYPSNAPAPIKQRATKQKTAI
jgi:hypothetical protein